MEEPKPQKQQIIPPGLESALQDWGESLTVILLVSALCVDLDPRAMASQTGDLLLNAAQSRSQRTPAQLPKICPNNSVTNEVLVASLIKAGLPTNATVISFIGHKVRYYLGDCKDVLTVDVKYTGNRYLAVAMKAPEIPTKIKPKN